MKSSTKIMVGLLAGIAIGWIAQSMRATWLSSTLIAIEPLGTVFIRLLSMVVVPLVIASLFVAVAALGSVRRLGRIGGKTIGWFLATTVAAAIIGFAVAMLAPFGSLADYGVPLASLQGGGAPSPVESTPSLVHILVNMIPQNPFASAAQGDLLPLIVAVCLFSAAASVVGGEGKRTVVAFFEGVNQMAMVVIGWLMHLAPVAVFILIAATVAKFGVEELQALLTFAIVAVVAMAVHVVLTLIPALVLGARQRLAAFLRATSETLLMAFSTASSSATLPVSMAAATTRLGISNEVASFVLPTGATINKNGSAVYKAVTAVFLMHFYGMPIGPGQALTIILVSTAAAFAGAGVPGSSLITTMIVLNAVGLGSNAVAGIAFIAAIDRPLDMCRTAVNTFSNLIIATCVARSEDADLAPA